MALTHSFKKQKYWYNEIKLTITIQYHYLHRLYINYHIRFKLKLFYQSLNLFFLLKQIMNKIFTTL